MDNPGKRLEELVDGCTGSVRMWLAGAHDDEPEESNAFGMERYCRSEAKKVAVEARDASEAAESLRSWFTDRMTIDPGNPGPFSGLAYDLLSNVLDLVDWRLIAVDLRRAISN